MPSQIVAAGMESREATRFHPQQIVDKFAERGQPLRPYPCSRCERVVGRDSQRTRSPSWRSGPLHACVSYTAGCWHESLFAASTGIVALARQLPCRVCYLHSEQRSTVLRSRLSSPCPLLPHGRELMRPNLRYPWWTPHRLRFRWRIRRQHRLRRLGRRPHSRNGDSQNKCNVRGLHGVNSDRAGLCISFLSRMTRLQATRWGADLHRQLRKAGEGSIQGGGGAE